MTSQQIRESGAVGVLAGVLALCGCGSDQEAAKRPAPTSSAARAPTAAPSGGLPGGLRGSWKRTMRARDWGPGGSGYPLGTWRADVGTDGAVSVYLPGTEAVDFTTQFVAKGRHLTIESIPVCPGQKGRYESSTSAGKMRLTVVDDACKARAALFGGAWTRRR